MTPLTAYYSPLVNGVLGSSALPSQPETPTRGVGFAPQPIAPTNTLQSFGSVQGTSPNFSMGPLSQIAYQMAGSPKLGPFADAGTPGQNPAFAYQNQLAGASGPGTGSGAGGAALGVLGALARNPSLVSGAYNALFGTTPAALGSSATSQVGADLMPGIESDFGSQIGSDTAANLAGLGTGAAAGSGVVDLSPALADISANATLPADVSGALATDAGAADAGAGAAGTGALGTAAGALGGAALAGGLVYGIGSLFDALDPLRQMTDQEIAATIPKQSAAAVSAQAQNPMKTSNDFSNIDLSQYLTPEQIAQLTAYNGVLA